MTTTVFRGGTVLTMDPARPRAGAVVVTDGRVAAVGPPTLADAHPDAAIVDLGERTLVPGFIDAHLHLSLAALHPRWADCSAVRDPETLARVLRAQAAAEPEAEWVRGVGWKIGRAHV